MTKSKRFALVKRYYEFLYWGIERVKKAVEKKWITTDEYKEITGEEYSEERE